MSIRGILFDKDGTLLDYYRTWIPINRVVARAVAEGEPGLADELLLAGGHDPHADTVLPGCALAAGSARDIAELWAPLLAARRGQAPDVGELTDRIDALFAAEGIRNAAPVCDLGEYLSALRGRGLRIGLATSDNERAARLTLEHLGVGDLFDFICGYDSGCGTKPGPGMVLGFCAATGLAPGAVAVVGDNVHDLHMGRSAGAGLVVGVLTGSSGAADLAPHADAVLADVRGMLDLLAG